MAEETTSYHCTLTPPDAAARIDADRALARRVIATQRLDTGLRVVFTEDSRQLVDTFVRNEQRCCGFFEFSVDASGEAVTLEITAPPVESAQRLVDAAKHVFDSGSVGMGPGTVK